MGYAAEAHRRLRQQLAVFAIILITGVREVLLEVLVCVGVPQSLRLEGGILCLEIFFILQNGALTSSSKKYKVTVFSC
jgi:hypothetical protein